VGTRGTAKRSGLYWGGRRDTVVWVRRVRLASRCDERIYRRVSIGALTVKYSFSNGSFWECSFCPKMAMMGAERPAADFEERPLSGLKPCHRTILDRSSADYHCKGSRADGSGKTARPNVPRRAIPFPTDEASD
jgi:hypothetical protein